MKINYSSCKHAAFWNWRFASATCLMMINLVFPVFSLVVVINAVSHSAKWVSIYFFPWLDYKYSAWLIIVIFWSSKTRLKSRKNPRLDVRIQWTKSTGWKITHKAEFASVFHPLSLLQLSDLAFLHIQAGQLPKNYSLSFWL